MDHEVKVELANVDQFLDYGLILADQLLTSSDCGLLKNRQKK